MKIFIKPEKLLKFYSNDKSRSYFACYSICICQTKKTFLLENLMCNLDFGWKFSGIYWFPCYTHSLVIALLLLMKFTSVCLTDIASNTKRSFRSVTFSIKTQREIDSGLISHKRVAKYRRIEYSSGICFFYDNNRMMFSMNIREWCLS